MSVANPCTIENSISKAGEHIRTLQDIIALSGNMRDAYKKALLSRLELQFALSLLKIEMGSNIGSHESRERTIDLDRALARLSLHAANALQLFRKNDREGCLRELYAADALISKIIPKLRKEKKGI